MPELTPDDVLQYVEHNIGYFHSKRIASIEKMKLVGILKRKNPYLFKAKNVSTSDEIVRGIVEAHLSSHEETIFGDWLEGLAIFINGKVYGGRKSGIQGIDLEFDNEGRRYIVAIKSGPNWGNSSQIRKMRSDFQTATRTLRTSGAELNIVAINGCCYGRDNKPDKGDYLKLCGQRFWEFISGNHNLYAEIIEPLGYRAKERNDEFHQAYSQMINRFIAEFSTNFCDEEGRIRWEQLLQFNSAE